MNAEEQHLRTLLRKIPAEPPRSITGEDILGLADQRHGTGRRPGQRWLPALAATVVLAAGLAVGLLEATSHNGSAPSPAPGANGSTATAPSTATSSAPTAPTVPAWAQKCLPKKAANRLGPAPEYVGLTRSRAIALANKHKDTLVPVGAAGRCITSSDMVYHLRKVAIVFDSALRIVVAERVSGGWGHGWAIN